MNSCNFFKKKTKEAEIKVDSVKSTQKINSAPSKLLGVNAKKAVEKWTEYQKVSELIKEYNNVSVLEALQNAAELSVATQKLRDSVKVEKLKNVTVKTRLNVLHNEVLRLKDMSKIPSISDKEVKEEVVKIRYLYDALNSKINDIYRVQQYDIKDIE